MSISLELTPVLGTRDRDRRPCAALRRRRGPRGWQKASAQMHR